MRKMAINIADWFIGVMYIVFITGVILFAYFQIKTRR